MQRLLRFRMLLLHFSCSQERRLLSLGRAADIEEKDDAFAVVLGRGRRHPSTVCEAVNQNNNGRTSGNSDLFHMEARVNHSRRITTQGEQMMTINQRGLKQQDCRECRYCGGRIATKGGRVGVGMVRDVSCTRVKSDINAGAVVRSGRDTVRTEKVIRAERGDCSARRQKTNMAPKQQQQQQQEQQQHRVRQQKKVISASTAKTGGKQSKNTDSNVTFPNDNQFERPSSPPQSYSSPRSKVAWLSGATSFSYHASVLEASRSKRLTPRSGCVCIRNSDQELSPRVSDETKVSFLDWSKAAELNLLKVAELNLAKHSLMSNRDARGGGGSTSNLSALSVSSELRRAASNSYAERLRKRSCLIQQPDSSSIGHNTNDNTKLSPTAIVQTDGKQLSKSFPPQSLGLYALSGSASLDHNVDTLSEIAQPCVKTTNSTSMCLKGVRPIPASRRLQSPTPLEGQWSKKSQQEVSVKPVQERPTTVPRHVTHIHGANPLQGGEAKKHVTRPAQNKTPRAYLGGGSNISVSRTKNVLNGIERRTVEIEKPSPRSSARNISERPKPLT